MLASTLLPLQSRPTNAAAQVKVGRVGVILFAAQITHELFSGLKDGDVRDGEMGCVKVWRRYCLRGESDRVIVWRVSKAKAISRTNTRVYHNTPVVIIAFAESIAATSSHVER